MRSVRSVALLILAAFTVLAGCNRAFGPYTPQSESARDSLKAQKLTQQAAKESDPEKAEQLLREALTADLYHGPAHNNLGVVLLHKGDLYSAASEFEWARKLLPGHPDPRMNLALTMEKAGRIDEALAAYASALEVYQEHIPTIQAMTRLRLKSGKPDDSTKAMLEEIALRGESPAWREWARGQLTRLDR
ncbi:MAG: tetratricopeptide repeat protein [Phycisphaeraceae bacterium]|nr:tetratricopeptide repeat protein [Phycisphaeraceae bacterium]